MSSSPSTPSSDRFHVKGLAKRVKRRISFAKARLASKEPEQPGSIHRNVSHGSKGPLTPVLKHIALSLSLNTAISIPVHTPVAPRQRTASASSVSTQESHLSKDRDLLASLPSSVSEAQEDTSSTSHLEDSEVSQDRGTEGTPSLLHLDSKPPGDLVERASEEVEVFGETVVEADQGGSSETVMAPSHEPNVPEPVAPSASEDAESLEAKIPVPEAASAVNEVLTSSSSHQIVEPEVVERAVVERAVVERAVVEPTAVEPTIVEPPAVEPAVAETAEAESAVDEPIVVEPEVVEPTVVEPKAVEPAETEPAVDEPIVVEPAVAESEVVESVKLAMPDSFLVDNPEDSVSDSELPTARLPPESSALLAESQIFVPADEISLSVQMPPPSSSTISPRLKSTSPSRFHLHRPLTQNPPSQRRPLSISRSWSCRRCSSRSRMYAFASISRGGTRNAQWCIIELTDPLTTLLVKYIPNPEMRPKRDLTGDWARTDFNTLVMTNSWRALARQARDRLVQADPEDLNLVLSLWYLRVSSLARLRLFNQTSAELTNLFTALSSAPPPARTHIFESLLPFELEVLYARVKYWAGDMLGHADALGALLHKCRRKARAARGSGSIAASQFIEMKDFTAATRLLEPLLDQPAQTYELRGAVARVCLVAGQMSAAERQFAVVDADPNVPQVIKDMNAALLASARGEWERAAELLDGLVAADAENFAAVNNLAVALLSGGKLKKSIQVLEFALQSSPSTLTMAEPFLFNLSTLYELRSAVAADKKRDLLVEVAKWSGDGLRTTCLKMPSG